MCLRNPVDGFVMLVVCTCSLLLIDKTIVGPLGLGSGWSGLSLCANPGT